MFKLISINYTIYLAIDIKIVINFYFIKFIRKISSLIYYNGINYDLFRLST